VVYLNKGRNPENTCYQEIAEAFIVRRIVVGYKKRGTCGSISMGEWFMLWVIISKKGKPIIHRRLSLGGAWILLIFYLISWSPRCPTRARSGLFKSAKL